LFILRRTRTQMKKRADTQTPMFRSTAELSALYLAEHRVN
jgi:hypothetical protein